MKLLDIAAFSGLNALLDGVPTCGGRVSCRVEAYSCKKVQSDKKLAKHVLERARNSPLAVPAEMTDGFPSPDDLPPISLGNENSPAAAGATAGRLSADDSEVAANFIATINVAFPDHDFSDVYPWSFQREDGEHVRRVVDGKLADPLARLALDGSPVAAHALWEEVERVAAPLEACEWYSFNPSSSDTPFEDALWEYFFFIYNRSPEVNKIVFLTLHGSTDDNSPPRDAASPHGADGDVERVMPSHSPRNSAPREHTPRSEVGFGAAEEDPVSQSPLPFDPVVLRRPEATRNSPEGRSAKSIQRNSESNRRRPAPTGDAAPAKIARIQSTDEASE